MSFYFFPAGVGDRQKVLAGLGDGKKGSGFDTWMPVTL